ncbi:MAG: hypothetical protein AUJ12_04205 [Alphaproteobacteria bacterium CG1_02_46_17]|nr:MAG: hypothetical protein AUJ12_04205 [Alphaproteobacteria bacterium CG1_02_46_17]
MMNLSSLSKARIFLFLALATTLLSMALQYTGGQSGLLMALIGSVTCLSLIIGYLFIGRATENLNKIKLFCEALTKGNLEERLCTPLEKSGEIEDLRQSINHYTDIIDAFVREAKYSMGSVCRNQFFRPINHLGMQGSFHQTAQIMNHATQSAKNKNKAITELAAVIRGIIGDEKQDAEKDHTAAAHGIESIAAATEESSTTIDEINRQVGQTVSSLDTAEKNAQNMEKSASVLELSTNEIADIISIINGIAEQTNLLALNATIEAARAGESGRGFAVVASEVKKLAGETSSATQKITSLMENIQHAVNNTVLQVQEMKDTISKINDFSLMISGAIEEQTYASREIARSATVVSSGLREIGGRVSNIQEVTIKLPQPVLAASVKEKTKVTAAA